MLVRTLLQADHVLDDTTNSFLEGKVAKSTYSIPHSCLLRWRDLLLSTSLPGANWGSGQSSHRTELVSTGQAQSTREKGAERLWGNKGCSTGGNFGFRKCGRPGRIFRRFSFAL